MYRILNSPAAPRHDQGFIMALPSSPRTTVAGIAAIVIALAGAAASWANGTPIDFTSVIAAVAAGIGLIQARDNKTTSEQAGAGK